MEKPSPPTAVSLPPKKHKLLSILNSCLELSGKSREFIEHLRDTFLPLGGPHSNATTTGASSIRRGSNASLGSNRYSFFAKGGQRTSTRALFSRANSASKPSNTLVGVPLSNIDKITHELRDFSTRVLKVLDIISTLAQFWQLNMKRKLEGLPRVAGLWELSLPENCEFEMSENASQAMSIAATSKRASPDVRVVGPEQQSRSKIGSDESDITLVTPDFLEKLMKEKSVQDSAVTQPLSTLKEESLVDSVKSVTSGSTDKGIPQ